MRSSVSRLALGLVLAAATAGCSPVPPPSSAGRTLVPLVDGEPNPVSAEEMRLANRDTVVDPIFPSHPVVSDSPNGLWTSENLFKTSASVIVSDPSPESQARAASLAVFAHAPMLVYSAETHAAITSEIERLQARRVLLVGEVGIAQSSGVPTVFRDPGGLTALGKLTAHKFEERVVDKPADLPAAVAALDGVTPVVLVPRWTTHPVETDADVPALPIQTRRDGLNSPVTVASADSPVAAVANARAYGAEVTFLDDPDPRTSDTALAAMIGLADQPLLALGRQFGTEEELAAAIREAEEKSTG